MFESPFNEGVIGRARRNGVIDIRLYNLRDYAHDRHRTVDDMQFGGGAGMLMKPEPIFEAIKSIRTFAKIDDESPVVLLSPQGKPLTQNTVEEFSRADSEDIVLICGRYEGFDERVREHLPTVEISIGDYVISGGEIAAMVVIEAVSRLVSGVVGSIESVKDDTFTSGLIQHPQYTRPAEFGGWEVPEVLLSGNHAEVDRWRRRESLRRTFERRPEMLESACLSKDDIQFLNTLKSQD